MILRDAQQRMLIGLTILIGLACTCSSLLLEQKSLHSQVSLFPQCSRPTSITCKNSIRTTTTRQCPNKNRVITALAASNPKNSNKSNKRAKGVYVRPSAVIERGSGFFFPGLEGPRVRLVVGSILLGVTAINHVLSSSSSVFSEILAVVFSLLVLLQGAIEASKEGRIETIAAAAATTSSRSDNETSSSNIAASKQQLSQQWSTISLEDERDENQVWRNRVEWSAASFLSLTPATHMTLIRQLDNNEDNNNIMQNNDDSSSAIVDYWLGVTALPKATLQQQAVGTKAALTTLESSKGGRVALPADHPAAVNIIPEETYRRCIVLQRITPTSCWMIASNDLLASFTKQDLQWLGQLATYVQRP